MFLPLSPRASAKSPTARFWLPLPEASGCRPIAVFALTSPEAIGILPMARLRLLSPLAFADNPNAVLRDEPGPLALAVLPQAVLSELPPSFPAGFAPTPPLLHSTAQAEGGSIVSMTAITMVATAQPHRSGEPNDRIRFLLRAGLVVIGGSPYVELVSAGGALSHAG